MHTSVLLALASRRGARRLLGGAALGLGLLGAAASAEAQTVYGLTGTPATPLLVTFVAGAATAGTPVPVTNLTVGETLVGLDTRPATGQLFALGYNPATDAAQVYTLNPTTGAATAVGAGIVLPLGGATERVGFDFNPAVDRIRLTSSNDVNYRLNPNNGAIVLADTPLNLPGGGNPAVGAVAYTNSFIGAATTVMYDVEESTSTLYIQTPPNSGTLTAPVSITRFGLPLLAATDQADLDFYTDPATRAETRLLSVANATGTAFYFLDVATGNASLAQTFAGVQVTDFAFAIDRTAPALTGPLAVGVTTAGSLITFDAANPGFIRTLVPVTGLAAGQVLAGTDFRPNTGQLFGLGYNPATGTANDRLYVIDPATGAATAVGTADFDLDLGTDAALIGFDFNPLVDRIRVEGGTNDKNYRLNPVTGAITATDMDLVYGPGDAGTGQNPNVATVAYTNSFIGSTSTGLFTLDHALGLVSLQTPPNNGVLTGSRSLVGVNPGGAGGAINAVNDLDVYYRAATSANVPYLAASPVGTTPTSLYTLDALGGTGNQTATLVGTIGLGSAVRDISITPDAAAVAPATLAALTGQLAYAVAGGNLVSFDTGNPGVIRSAVNITGLPSAAGVAEVLAGADFRPLTGELFALGYNAANQTGQLYTLNLTTGALTAVGGLVAYPLGASAAGVGFDFNPVVDRIRITGATNQANLRVNPADGVVIADTPLNNVAGTPAISAVAYTNNDNNASSGTTLFGYDQARNVLLRSTNANGGVYVDQGPTGLSVNANGVDFDIFTDNGSGANTAFAVAAPTGTTADNLYAVNTATGAFASQGRIGLGSNLTALAVFLTPGPTANLLTFTGLTSSDYGTAANWNPQAVPTATSNVLIPAATPNPAVVSNAQAALNLTINAGGSLSTDGGTLSVAGNIANAGTLAGTGAGTVLLNGTTARTVGGAGSTVFRNLTVANAAGTSTTGPVAVQQALTLNGPLAIGAGQAFTLRSDASGTAYVVPGAGGSVSGQATVQRYLTPTNPGLGYRHYAAPVSGSTVADLATAGFAPEVSQGAAYNASATPGTVVPFPNVFAYEQGRVGTVTSNFSDFDKGWQAPTSLTDTLAVGRGYTVNISAAATTVDFNGTLTGGTLALTGLARGTNPDAGWHLLGNPYPSALDWNLVRGGSLSNVADALYVFKSNGQYTGSYAAYVNGASTNGGTNVLPLGQAFFVRATSTATPGSVTFENSQRLASAAANNTAFQRGAADVRPLLTLNLQGGLASQQTVVYFEAGATAAGTDARHDASALPATHGLTLATEAGAEALAINGLPALAGATVTVPLRLQVARTGTYILAIDELRHLPTGYRAYLRDGLSGQLTDLALTPRLALALTANAPASGRFALVFGPQATALATAPAALAALATVYPNPAHGTATLLLPAALRGAAPVPVQVLDNLGRVVLTRTATADVLALPLEGLVPGLYTVQARTAAGLVSRKLVVE